MTFEGSTAEVVTGRTADPAEEERVRLRGRMVLALGLFPVGFLLAWIPLVNTLGEIVILAGFLAAYSGRASFGKENERLVVLASNLLLASVVVALALDVTLGSLEVRYGPGLALVETYAFTAIAAYSVTVLPDYFATTSTRRILWAAYAASLASILVASVVPAVGAVNLAIVNRLTGSTVLGVSTGDPGVLSVVPYALFAWAYLRCRRAALVARDAGTGAAG